MPAATCKRVGALPKLTDLLTTLFSSWGRFFFEAIHVLTVHVKQIPGLAYFKIFDLFFGSRMCC